MRIGLLSDSHGAVSRTADAVSLLLDQGAELLLHLGDVESEEVMDELIGHPVRLVLGNCDWNVKRLTSYAQFAGLTVDHPCGDLMIDDKRIVYTHGHIDRLMFEALDAEVDYLIHGHSHEVRDEHIGSTRVLNPGALYRASRYTVAVLDPLADNFQVFEVPQPPK